MLVLYPRSEKICRTIFTPTSSRGLFLNISPIAKNIGSRRATAESACTKKNQRGSVQWCVPWEPPSKWTAPSGVSVSPVTSVEPHTSPRWTRSSSPAGLRCATSSPSQGSHSWLNPSLLFRDIILHASFACFEIICYSDNVNFDLPCKWWSMLKS